MLQDKFGRHIDYLRIAVTDKCNLRCFYCMPEKGIDFLKKTELLSFEEMTRLIRILASLGVKKVRITGGEPFLRKEIIHFIDDISKIRGIEKISLTTNGTLTVKYIDELRRIGVNDINLSIDSLDPNRFFEITRRNMFDQVWECFNKLVESKFNVKLNCVVMEKQNIEDIIPMVELTKDSSISVRFIEEMPFNGAGNSEQTLKWNHQAILKHIESTFSEIETLKRSSSDTSFNYRVKGFKGEFGIIPAYTRTICGGCNRIRITPQGMLKTCLYDEGVFSLRDLMRAGATDQQLKQTLIDAVANKAKDGFEAEKNRIDRHISESMAMIGG